MSEDPYRTPGVVETSQERRYRLYKELMGLYACDVRGWTADQRAAFQTRVDTLRSALAALR